MSREDLNNRNSSTLIAIAKGSLVLTRTWLGEGPGEDSRSAEPSQFSSLLSFCCFYTDHFFINPLLFLLPRRQLGMQGCVKLPNQLCSSASYTLPCTPLLTMLLNVPSDPVTVKSSHDIYLLPRKPAAREWDVWSDKSFHGGRMWIQYTYIIDNKHLREKKTERNRREGTQGWYRMRTPRRGGYEGTSFFFHVARAQCKVDLFFEQAHLERPFERRIMFAGNSENDPFKDILEPCTFASDEFCPE